MAGKLDTQGWIDATRNGRAYAFFLRNEILWVRRNGKYKRTQVSGIDTIAGARVLAGSIAAGDPGFRRGGRCVFLATTMEIIYSWGCAIAQNGGQIALRG
jgi:hypothetical protein